MSEKYLKFLPELLESVKICTADELIKLFNSGKKESTFRALLSVKKQYIDCIINNNFESFFNDNGFTEVIPTEVIHSSMLVPYFKLPKEDRRIYVISQDFFSKFRHLKLDTLQFKHLPSSLTGYVELPEKIFDEDGMEIAGFFFYIGDKKNISSKAWPNPHQSKPYTVTDKVICFGFSDPQLNTNSFSWTYIPENLDIHIEESHKNVPTISFSTEQIIESISNSYPNHLAIMFNMLAYLNTGAPDIRDFKNPIRYQSSTSKTPVKADKILSDTAIVRVGFSFKKERMYAFGESWVETFPRWQRCGENLSQVKLIWVKPFSRHYKNFKQKVFKQVEE